MSKARVVVRVPVRNEHVGFAAMVKKGSPALAASIGRKKYGADKMAKASRTGKALSDKDRLKKNQATQVTFNLSGAKMRREELLGEEHLVIPTVSIVEGVLNGTAGPLLYPREELALDPSSWDHMPVVLFHPEKNGRGMSARDADVLNNQGIGILLNSEYKHPKLKHEVWLNAARLEQKAPEVLAALEKGEPVEVSTGLYTDNELCENEETFGGKPYYAIARNHRPDHLAVLPGQVGACSVKDGAGLLRNSSFTADHKHQLVSDAMRKKHGPSSSYTYPEAVSDTHVFYRAPGGDMVHQPYKINAKGTKAKLRGQPMPVVKKAQYCDPDTGKAIANATWEPQGSRVADPQADGENGSADPATKTTVGTFEAMARRIQLAAPQGKGKVALEGGRFVTVPNVTNANEETVTMKKSAMVAALIANASTVWDEDDREALESMPKDKVAAHYEKAVENGQLTKGEGDDNDEDEDGVNTGVKSKSSKDKPKSKKVAASGPGVTGNAAKKSSEDSEDSSADSSEDTTPPAKGKKTTGNEEQAQPATFDEILQNADPEMAAALREAVSMRADAKKTLVGNILKNKRNTFDKASLKAMSLNQLKKLALLAGGDEPARRPVANFEGLGFETTGRVENEAEDGVGAVGVLGIAGMMDEPAK